METPTRAGAAASRWALQTGVALPPRPSAHIPIPSQASWLRASSHVPTRLAVRGWLSSAWRPFLVVLLLGICWCQCCPHTCCCCVRCPCCPEKSAAAPRPVSTPHPPRIYSHVCPGSRAGRPSASWDSVTPGGHEGVVWGKWAKEDLLLYMIIYILQLVTYFSFDLFQVFPFEGIIYAQGKKKKKSNSTKHCSRQVKVLLNKI